MIPYLLRRLVEALPTLFLVSVVVFFLTRILPGDPVRLLLGEEPDPKVAEEVRRSLGLDRPLLVQYASWLWNLFQGDLGRSIKDGTPVARLILEKLPTTLELATLAMLVALAIGLPSGVVAAVRRGTWLDGLVTSTSLMGVSVPNFFLGIMLIYLFSLRLGWVPPSGYVELWIDPKRNLLLMVLPAVTLGTALAGAIARFTRNSLLEVLSQDYIRTAKAKGVSSAAVVLKHGLRNAAIPIVTVLGLQLGGLLGGAVVTEQIFSIPGFGRLVVDAVFTRDFTVLQGVVLTSALAVFVVNTAVDVLYALIDPRIRYR
ncbi:MULTISPECIES: ABC transporter permease [Thermus]|uniref:ABC transporter permease n=2 Tax=Thermus scotoductus TaxID=37636 RepID=A0A430R6B6_THESC|nr:MULTISPECIES: ABC transporter permease [Thermus]ADW21820.1 putative peptide ABC transporter permease protein y4tP [Thermus scotoductus SA-01]RTH02965.1 ABC transporter permease [Thermus scotoductus]